MEAGRSRNCVVYRRSSAGKPLGSRDVKKHWAEARDGGGSRWVREAEGRTGKDGPGGGGRRPGSEGM